MLGRLCRWIRILGFSAEYVSGGDDDRIIAEKAESSGLILVTRDVLLSARVKDSLLIHSLEIDGQLTEFMKRFHPVDSLMFTRCTVCNSHLRRVSTTDPALKLPPMIRDRFREVEWCNRCSKAYWEGTHYEQMKRKISMILESEHANP
ncbi:MAG: Mut7-C RNAse domain-containing protein [Candidatus Thermoplasmatota archaeon]|jgi:uncharacterized protein with PIN domain|nr:Mut7-C RNAse domain-containing protein [Candidatus Thermoplasmatota archaeon]